MPLTRSNVLQNWAAYSAGMVFFLYAFIQRVAPSIMTEELMRDFKVGATSLGVLSGAYFFAYAALQLPVGLLIDRFGPRRLMSGAALIGCLASLGFASSDTLLAATVFRALIGAAVAFAFVGTLSILSAEFKPGLFSLLAGILQSMGMAGALMGQAPLRRLIEIRGWQQVFRDLGWFAAFLAIVLYLLVPRRRNKAVEDEAPSRKQVAQNNLSISAAKSEDKQTQLSFSRSLLLVIRNRQSWYCALFGFGMAAPMLSFAGLWGIPWAQVAYDLAPVTAAATVSWLFIGWALFAPLAGWLSEFMQLRKPVLIAGAILSLSTLALLIYLPGWSTISLRSLLFLCGCGGSTMIVLFSSVKELNDQRSNAAAMGFANMFVVGSGGILQFLLGWMLDLSAGNFNQAGVLRFALHDYHKAFAILIGTAFMALVTALLIRETGAGSRHQAVSKR